MKLNANVLLALLLFTYTAIDAKAPTMPLTSSSDYAKMRTIPANYPYSNDAKIVAKIQKPKYVIDSILLFKPTSGSAEQLDSRGISYYNKYGQEISSKVLSLVNGKWKVTLCDTSIYDEKGRLSQYLNMPYSFELEKLTPKYREIYVYDDSNR
ncbi:MAG: hypothetical protein RSC04_01395, partial [Bacteroidales bacterium]